MAAPNEAKREQLGYFHALGKVATEGSQEVFESLYKSSHNMRSSDVWADTVAYAVDASAADTEASSNDAVTKYTQTSLTEIPGSNGQAWYLDNGGTFVRPWISPVDVPHSVTAAPSYGYQALLYQSDNTLITPTEGVWLIDYYAGIVLCQTGYTPSNMGWGTPKISNYIYTGQSVSDILNNLVAVSNVENEDLTSQIDGVENVFTLDNTPSSGSLRLYLNGIRQRIALDYTLSNDEVTMLDVPESGDYLLADYRY